MKKLIVFACLATAISMTAGTAMADSIRGKLGVTGRVGFVNPADNTADPAPGYPNNRTDSGYVAGGGLIYGIDDHIALECEVTRTQFGSETGDFGVTDLSFGGQYRFALQQRQLVPYIGVGLDILVSDYDENSGLSSDVETTVGAHLSGGVDFFLQRNLALTAEAKVVIAPNAKITDRQTGNSAGNFDPSNFSTTIGFRYFFN
jgi:outer membrane protein